MTSPTPLNKKGERLLKPLVCLYEKKIKRTFDFKNRELRITWIDIIHTRHVLQAEIIVIEDDFVVIIHLIQDETKITWTHSLFYYIRRLIPFFIMRSISHVYLKVNSIVN